jgi:hypothetical protein
MVRRREERGEKAYLGNYINKKYRALVFYYSTRHGLLWIDIVKLNFFSLE